MLSSSIRALARRFRGRARSPPDALPFAEELPAFSLDAPLFYFGPNDAFTARDACENLLVLGTTGSGKTTGPLAMILSSLLDSGAGLVCLSVKADEPERVARAARACGRESDLLFYGPGHANTCNLLGYECSQPGATPQAACSFLGTIMEVATRGSAGQGGNADYFRGMRERVMEGAVTAVHLADPPASLDKVHLLVASAPRLPDQLRDAGWVAASYCMKCLAGVLAGPPSTDGLLAVGLFQRELPYLSPNTQSCVLTDVMMVLTRFVGGTFGPLVSADVSTVSPADVVERQKILILDAPVLKYREAGQFFQLAVKLLVQRAILRRSVAADTPLAVVYADEAGWFLAPAADSLFLSVCRQSRGCVVSAAQSLPLLLGTAGPHHEEDVYSWIGNHATKIIAASGCPTSNEFYSRLLGDRRELLMSGGADPSPYSLADDLLGHGRRSSAGFGEQYQPVVRPAEFTRLAKGGPANDWLVECIAFQNGREFAGSGQTHLRCRFPQDIPGRDGR